MSSDLKKGLRTEALPLIFENADFVAVDKPHGLSIHNKEDPENLQELLQKQLGKKILYPVHRLDKETSGVQLFALNDKYAKKMAQEFENSRVEKTYVGLLRGVLAKEKGVWNKPLTDKAEGRKNPAGTGPQRVPCETRFQVLKSNQYFSLCEFDLITGRQHQIRKHAAIEKHALVGDPRYGDEKYNKRMAEIYKTSRMFLHCHRLKILDYTFESALPQEFSI